MNRLRFYVRYALRALHRDGTRTFLAGLSVTFGVLSLVAMQLLSVALLHGTMFDEHRQMGGDLQIRAAAYGDPLTSDDLAQIETWRQQGLIADYTLTSESSALYMRTPSSGRVTLVSRALGIDPASYPLVGSLTLRDPAGSVPADVLRRPTDALVTRDIADPLGLRVGDTFTLTGEGAPVQLTVAGIIGAMPDDHGKQVLYSLDTARLIENRPDVVNTVSANLGTMPGAVQTLVDSPMQVFTARDREAAVSSNSGTLLFDIMLKGAGVLGLLVGGLSVSNTLQVMLARRKLEIAMLKTVGFRRGDLLALISLETGLLGLIGGIVGAWIGTRIAGQLLDVLAGSGAFLIAWTPDPVIVGGGIVAGFMTAVVFGMQAILASSATRPVELLRDLPSKTPRQESAARLALYGLLALVFGALVGIVLGSVPLGIACVLVGGLLLIVLRGVFWAVLWLAVKLPLPPIPTLKLARASLRQRKTQSSLAVMALFAGAFSVTFAALVIYNAQATVLNSRASDAGYNLAIFTSVDQADAALAQLVTQGAQSPFISDSATAALDGVPVDVTGLDSAGLGAVLTYTGTWDDQLDGALLPQRDTATHQIGDILTLSSGTRQQRVTLVGFYEADGNSITGTITGIVVPRRVAEVLGGDRTQVRVLGAFPVPTLDAATTAVGKALPDALVFSRADVNDLLAATYRTLFTFAASIASLAFVAGAVLIANSAGLTVVERRGEIGVFKAVGYTSGRVLRMFLSEYGFLGAVAGVFGVIAVIIAVMLINAAEPGVNMVVEPLITGGMLLFSVAIALASATAVAWQPTRVRPLDVLRYE